MARLKKNQHDEVQLSGVVITCNHNDRLGSGFSQSEQLDTASIVTVKKRQVCLVIGYGQMK